MKRKCGECQLCCELVPVKELGKNAGERCAHQTPACGCAIYPERPNSCRQWSCEWLDSGANVLRPDIGHYIIDPIMDFVRIREEGATEQRFPAAQIWVDPNYPDAHREPKLRAYLDAKNIPAIIRYSNCEGFLLLPPRMVIERQWRECKDASFAEPEHTLEEITRFFTSLPAPKPSAPRSLAELKRRLAYDM